MNGAARNWAAATRPKTLLAAVGPVVVGTGFAFRDGGEHLVWAVLALLTALLLQVGTNLHNDWADAHHGADGADRTGPLRVTQSGLLSSKTVLRAALAVFAAAAAVGVAGTVRGGWPIAAIAASSVAAGVAYTGGKRPLGYRGLGDIAVLLFFGPVAVGGTYYIQTLDLTPTAALAGLGPGLLATAVLVANNLRDRDSDAQVGKRTLAVRFGARFARSEYTVAVVVGVALPTLLLATSGYHLWHLLPLAAAPVALRLLARLWRGADGAALNPLLAGTAQLLLLSCTLTCVAAIASA